MLIPRWTALTGGMNVGGRNVGLLADVFGIETQKELGHGRIARDDQMGDQGSVDLAHLEQFLMMPLIVETTTSCSLFQSAGFLGVDDPGDHVLSVTDLAIVIRGLGQGEEDWRRHIGHPDRPTTTHSLRLRIWPKMVVVPISMTME